MKYFDAQKRKETYTNTKKIKEFKKIIVSGEYLNTPLEDRLEIFENWIDEVPEDYNAVLISITVEDEGEDILTDEEVFEVMSNAATAFAKSFPRQEEKVLLPKRNLLDNLPISPFSTIALTRVYNVDKLLQISIHRHHRESGSYENVRLV